MLRTGGCGACRDCRLALGDHHPNEFVVEPEGRDIHVDTIREEVWQPAYRTAPEPGRKVFLIREADRLSPAAADTLLKVLEEPPADAVFLLLSARAHELPDTVLSRVPRGDVHRACRSRSSSPQLVGEGVAAGPRPASPRGSPAATSGARGGSPRPTTAWRSATRPIAALELAAKGPAGALDAASEVLESRQGLQERD